MAQLERLRISEEKALQAVPSKQFLLGYCDNVEAPGKEYKMEIGPASDSEPGQSLDSNRVIQ